MDEGFEAVSLPKAWQILLQKIYEILDEHPDNHNYGIDRILLALNQKDEYPPLVIYREKVAAGELKTAA